MKESTINVRLDATLKQHGMEVLNDCGMSVTDAVRTLFQYMESNRTLPPELANSTKQEDVYQQRRKMMRSLIGILPSDVTLEEAREARLSKHFA